MTNEWFAICHLSSDIFGIPKSPNPGSVFGRLPFVIRRWSSEASPNPQIPAAATRLWEVPRVKSDGVVTDTLTRAGYIAAKSFTTTTRVIGHSYDGLYRLTEAGYSTGGSRLPKSLMLTPGQPLC